MKNKERISLLHAFLIEGIGARTLSSITENYSKRINFYSLGLKDILSFGILLDKAEKIYLGLKDERCLKNYELLLEKNNMSFLTPYDTDYPSLLRSLEVSPPILFYIGKNDFSSLKNSTFLSMVSARKTNFYGKKVIKNLIEGLAGQDITIVSGGAIGGDSYIHEAALSNGLKTISYIGSGLLHWYPKNNTKLFENIILQNGYIMSHFHVQTTPSKTTFPIRNSVIAAMSQTTIVIQAGSSSGTLITANYALDYGRDVGSVPGPIDDTLMIGSNNLMKMGAHVITSAQDILHLLGIEEKKFNNVNKLKSKDLYTNVSELEKLIINFCSYPRSLEEVCETFELSTTDTYQMLFGLLEKKILKQDFLGNWIIF